MSIRNRVVTSPKQGWLEDQFQIRDIKQPLQGHHQLVMHGTAQKKSRKKIKKSTTSGSERTPVGKLNKSLFQYVSNL